jgi:hypothetical protein
MKIKQKKKRRRKRYTRIEGGEATREVGPRSIFYLQLCGLHVSIGCRKCRGSPSQKLLVVHFALIMIAED